MDFNGGWKFQEGSPLGAQEEDFDDSAWQDVTLPHDWSIYKSFTSGDSGNAQQGYLSTGNGWYRKTFSLAEDQKGKRISIDFDGVMYVSTVYVNGVEVGTEYYGYTAFSYDITDLLYQDGENVIAVKCENSKNNSRWYTGAGIYRDVTLTVTEDVHVARNGTYVTFPIDGDTDEKAFSMDQDAVLAYIAKGEADADIDTEVENDS